MIHKTLVHPQLAAQPNVPLRCLPCIRPSLSRRYVSQFQYEASSTSSSYPSRCQQSGAQRPARTLASTANEEAASTSLDHQTSTSAPDEEDPNFGLILPDKHYQGALDMATRNQLKSRANTAAREKTLMYLQVGQNGLTQPFLANTMDLLGKYELVRVRLPDGMDKWKATRALERLLDCVCVQQIGFTSTLYRKRGLPRPSNCPPNAQPSPRALQNASGKGGKASEDSAQSRQRVGQRGKVTRGKSATPRQRQNLGEQRPQFNVI
ncbi:hypothetical protein DUNSADRAFT_1345 [Dunaliella salina]|uniref:CRM domain-containing protein n=1 Tax=Dunaliella salina TaxID=3046 RepID=A0ABQ7GX75_DUNSA|nr:hypothetical protein DUNSADRAFT_1345 [Dunaliella salina]|eukprot:KAF5839209.1 hypothetical protein DUNSADRAFT_1345 [Dunaliella salina]